MTQNLRACAGLAAAIAVFISGCGSSQNIESFAPRQAQNPVDNGAQHNDGDASATTTSSTPATGNNTPAPGGNAPAPGGGSTVVDGGGQTPIPSVSDDSVPPPPSNSEASLTGQEVFAIVNTERASRNLSALVWDERLFRVAQNHAEDMVKRGFFNHTDPDGRGPGERLKAALLRTLAWGENIAAGQPSPEEVMSAWMKSAGHRANILKPTFKHVGIGVKDRVWVQVFSGGLTEVSN